MVCRQHVGGLRLWRAGRLQDGVHAGGMQEGQLDGCAGSGRQVGVVAVRKVAGWGACRGHAGRPTGWLCRKGQAGWHVGVVAVRKANLLDAGIGCVPNNKDHRICRQHAGRLRLWQARRLLGGVHAGACRKVN